MQTGKTVKYVSLTVDFSETEFELLLKKVGDWEPGAEAKFIHSLVMNSLNRKPRKAKAEGGQ